MKTDALIVRESLQAGEIPFLGVNTKGVGGKYNSSARQVQVEKGSASDRTSADYIAHYGLGKSRTAKNTRAQIDQICRKDVLALSSVDDDGKADLAQRAAYQGNYNELSVFFDPKKTYDYLPHHPIFLLNRDTKEGVAQASIELIGKMNIPQFIKVIQRNIQDPDSLLNPNILVDFLRIAVRDTDVNSILTDPVVKDSINALLDSLSNGVEGSADAIVGFAQLLVDSDRVRALTASRDKKTIMSSILENLDSSGQQQAEAMRALIDFSKLLSNLKMGEQLAKVYHNGTPLENLLKLAGNEAVLKPLLEYSRLLIDSNDSEVLVTKTSEGRYPIEYILDGIQNETEGSGQALIAFSRLLKISGQVDNLALDYNGSTIVDHLINYYSSSDNVSSGKTLESFLTVLADNNIELRREDITNLSSLEIGDENNSLKKLIKTRFS